MSRAVKFRPDSAQVNRGLEYPRGKRPYCSSNMKRSTDIESGISGNWGTHDGEVKGIAANMWEL